MASDATETSSEWTLLAGQYELLRALESRARGRNETTARALMFPMLHAIEESTGTLRDLARLSRTRDCYVIARVVYETE